MDFAPLLEPVKQALASAQKPIFFFDDDPDGLASFLLLYRYVKRGKGVIVKSTPKITEADATKVSEFGADKVFALDLPFVESGFIERCGVPVVWIDHHTPQKPNSALYFNPRSFEPDLYMPVSQIAYDIVKSDIWIAAAGVVGDFAIPSFLAEFKRAYPGYIGRQKTPEQLLFKTKLGRLINVLALILKGPTHRVMQCVKILTRLEHPDEILEQSTPQGRFIYSFYEKHRRVYDALLRQARQAYKPHEPMLVFVYPSERLSLTSDLAMELLHLYPSKLVVVGREKDGEMKLSLRCKRIPIREAVEKALDGLKGYGGGHEYACGANVAIEDFEKFLTRLKQTLFKSP